MKLRHTLLFTVLLTGCIGQLDLGSGDDKAPGIGGESSTPDGQEESAAPDLTPGTTAECHDSAPAPARRRTNEEFRFAIEDAFDVQVADLTAELPPDPRVEGFVNTAPALTIDGQRIRAYLEVARGVVDRVDWSPWYDRHASCRAVEDVCRDNWIAGLGEELLSRPMAEEEIAPLRNVFTTAATADSDAEASFEAGAEAVATALLISPQFLFRFQPTEVDSTELADRLAQLIWQAPADDWLRQQADDGALDDDDGIRQTVDAMMNDPRAKRSLHRFVEDWLHLGNLDRQVRDEGAYPEFSEELLESMRRETHHLFDTIVWEEDGDLLGALDSTRTFIDDPALAELYGFEPTGAPGEIAEYEFDPAMGRSGVLGHASVLTLNSQNEHEQMIYRGLYIRETVFCSSVASPPPEALEADAIDVDDTWSARRQAEARLDAPQCAGCHAQFEPLAFGLEPFDALGAYQSVDSHGNEVRSDGELMTADGTKSAYEDLAQFASLLAADEAVSECVAKKGTQFAWGRALEHTDRCALEEIAADFESNGRTWRGLIKAIATHPSFRAVEAAEQPEVTR